MLTVAFTVGEHMKEQYLGDVSDYRKYALLRALTTGSDLRLGVCWMLTPADGRADGNRLKYLKDTAKWRTHDPAVFDLLERLVTQPESRRLNAIELSGIFPGATFFDRHILDDRNGRSEYMAEAKSRLRDRDLVFFDPDNGLEVKSVRKGQKNSSKYLYLDEIADFWAGGASLLIYQHYPMVKRSTFEAEVSRAVSAATPGAIITLFRTPHALFVLAAHPRHQDAFTLRVSKFSTDWPDWFISPIHSDILPAKDVPSSPKAIAEQTSKRSANGPMVMEVCELKALGSKWAKTSIEDALPQRGKAQMRCVECHGEVKPHRAWRSGRNRAHFEHVQKHAGCSHSRHFTGVRANHPLPVK